MEGIPDESTVAKAAELSVFDSTGSQVKFGDLFKDKKTIVVFIRHFFCGSCQAYVSQLASVKQEALDAAGVQLVVVGCGSHEPIANYASLTGFRAGAIYADPARALFRLFGFPENLALTPAGEQRKSYLAGRSFIGNALSSIWNGLKAPHHLGKQGNLSQLGGEFIFGPGNQCTYASRMKHTEDHIEVADLMKEAGVEYP
ncbi:AhpC/TSA antioxidant enzyme family protein [Phanerochaete sordida]|uniref:AhpC/TSA antioxidant enzyme family protein n=1 Tax=Phanerochaete sordida TaxID=48140 RepID=A0A9P3G8X4_9APHY|nr:AhpC/TSA antioxidant enzyme family protein [Phanerochaete sordida]